MRILIAGGFGFIGGRLADHLAREGHQIILGSRKLLSPPEWMPQAEVANIAWDNVGQIEKICKGIDVIVDAAGMNARDCESDPIAALVFNGLGTARLVEGGCRAGVRRFIYISTAHVYANPLIGTITEKTCITNLHPYATSHRAGEDLVLGANLRGDIDGTVLRLSNAFGAPMSRDVNCWTLLINDLCKQAVENHKLVLKTSGLQYRDFIGLTEFCSIVGALCNIESLPDGSEVLNIGSGLSMTVLDITKMIQRRCSEVLGFEVKIECPQGGASSQHAILNYETCRLMALGLDFTRLKSETEIDRLLYFCQKVFTEK